MIPDPVWAAPALAAVQFADVAFSWRPMRFVQLCLEDVRFPRRYWWVFPPIKFAAGLGLLIGLWVRFVGAITAGALVVYFVLAVASHLRVRDIGRNLASATWLLGASTFVLLSFLRA
jgi:uncharacterized membrane protein YphA (DoxX/SURF4 family)